MMSALSELIQTEIDRHEAEASFNLRCKCGLVEKTVSRRGDFARHLSEALAEALSAAGLAVAAEVLEQAAEAAQDPTPEDMDQYFIDQSDVGPWLRARAAAERAEVPHAD